MKEEKATLVYLCNRKTTAKEVKNGFFCTSCQINVHNLCNKTSEEIEDLLQTSQNNKICGILPISEVNIQGNSIREKVLKKYQQALTNRNKGWFQFMLIFFLSALVLFSGCKRHRVAGTYAKKNVLNKQESTLGKQKTPN